MNDFNPLSPPPRDREGARKKALNHFAVRELRDSEFPPHIQRVDRTIKFATIEELGAFLKEQLSVWGTVAREAGSQ